MKILLFEWNSFGILKVVHTLKNLGHTVERMDFNPKEEMYEEYEKGTDKLLSYGYFDIVFSINYFKLIARVCHKNKIPYISWIYDSPMAEVWDESAFYPENTIFSFDEALCRTLRKKGVNRIFYMPLAADTNNIETVQLTQKGMERFSSEVSFVGKFYDEETDMEKALKANKADFLKGYSDAVMEAQTKISSYNFMEEVTEPEDIRKQINSFYLESARAGSLISKSTIFANYYLSKETTKRERRRLIEAVAERFPLNIYTQSDISMIPKAINKGSVNYYTEMPLVFKFSKINLNITLRSIQTGIPLRVFDIMAAGGFVLTNYQQDMLKHFEPGVDFAYFVNEEDLLEKIEYYLTHEEERKQIAKNGFEKVKKNHNYKITIERMLKFALEGEEYVNCFL